MAGSEPDSAATTAVKVVTYGRKVTQTVEEPLTLGSGATAQMLTPVGPWDQPDASPSPPRGAKRFDFGWRRKLQEIDDEDDLQNPACTPPTFPDDSPGAQEPLFTSPRSSQRMPSTSAQVLGPELSEENMESSFDGDNTKDSTHVKGALTTPPTSSPNCGNTPSTGPGGVTTFSDEAAEDTKDTERKLQRPRRKGKGLSKKELKEATLVTARIRADKVVRISQLGEVTLQMDSFLDKIKAQNLSTKSRGNIRTQVSSDPIASEEDCGPLPLASPIGDDHGIPSFGSPLVLREKRKPSGAQSKSPTLDDDDLKFQNSSDSDDLLSGTNIVERNLERRKAEKRTIALDRKKRRAMQIQTPNLNQSDDDDVIDVEGSSRLTMMKSKPDRLLVTRQSKPRGRWKVPRAIPNTASSRSRNNLLEKSILKAKELDAEKQKLWKARGGVVDGRARNAPQQFDLSAAILKRSQLAATNEVETSSEVDVESEYDFENNVSPKTLSVSGRYSPSEGMDNEDTDKENVAPEPRVPSPLDISRDRALDANDENACPTPVQGQSRLFGDQCSKHEVEDEDVENLHFIVPRRRAKPELYFSDEEEMEHIASPATVPCSVTTRNAKVLVPDSSFVLQQEEELNNDISIDTLRIAHPSPRITPTGPMIDAPLEFEELGFSQIFAEEKPAKCLVGTLSSELALTQDDNRLLPPIEMSTQQLLEEEEIFREDAEQKRREFDKPAERSSRAALSDLVLPQNAVVSAQGVHPAAGRPMIMSSQEATYRKPLKTLSLSALDSFEDEGTATLRRLRRGPNTHKTPQNAFEIMLAAPQKQEMKAQQEKRQKNVMSEFIVDEAAESDDEKMLGFGGATAASDEAEGDESLEGVVEGLLDDNAMEIDIENLDKVLEKHKENEAEDDAKLQKNIQDVIEGKRRGKRRDRGIGLSDSEESSEAEEDARRRQKMYSKKRKINADTLEALAENPDTQAFHQEYVKGIYADDGKEFTYLKLDYPLSSTGVSANFPDTIESSGDESPGETLSQGSKNATRQPLTASRSLIHERVMSHDNEENIARYREVLQRTTGSLSRGAGSGRVISEVKNRNDPRKRLWAKEESLSTGSASSKSITVTGHSHMLNGLANNHQSKSVVQPESVPATSSRAATSSGRLPTRTLERLLKRSGFEF